MENYGDCEHMTIARIYGPFPNASPKLEARNYYRMSLYAVELKYAFTGYRIKPKPAPV